MAQIFGTDTSSYQPIGTYDPGAFEILNIQDPQFEAKIAKNNSEGRPTDFYVWCYADNRNEAFFRSTIDRAKRAGLTRGWLDYEEEGPEGAWRAEIWFRVADEMGIKSGFYANDWRLPIEPFAARPFWLAGYPDPNDGVWRDSFAPRSKRDVQIWQWSSGGGLDRNVIIDEKWWHDWIGAPAVPADKPKVTEENAMLYVATSDSRSGRVKKDDVILTDSLSVTKVDSVNSVHNVGVAFLPGSTIEAIWSDKDRSRGYR